MKALVPESCKGIESVINKPKAMLRKQEDLPYFTVTLK